jgi:hypothetical protein
MFSKVLTKDYCKYNLLLFKPTNNKQVADSQMDLSFTASSNHERSQTSVTYIVKGILG